MNISKKIIAFSFIAVVGFGLGYITRDIQAEKIYSQPDSDKVDFSLLWEAFHMLEKNFVNSNGIDYQKLVHGAIAGMVKSLDDPYTLFFDPEDTKRFLEDVDGRFEGVGMEVGLKNEMITIIAPLKGTPADKAGLLAGDIILEIDGNHTRDMSVQAAVELIRGPRGTKVVLTIARAGWTENESFSIERDVIELPSLEWELIEETAHIKFHHFYRKAGNDFKEIAIDIINSPAKGIVLDLRNNSGGYLDVAEDIGGWFFEKGTLFVIEDSGAKLTERYTAGSGRFLGYPVVVVINQGSASAAEILAGALRDNKDASIIGEKSFGKGSIQKLEYLSDKSSIKITVANWLTPNGSLIAEKGLVPDFEVEDSEDTDYSLQKAIEVLKEIM